MMFLFAYIGTLTGQWPVGLMHASEAVLFCVACASFVLACLIPAMGMSTGWEAIARTVIAAIGGASASVALIMPFELAPFFFGAKGEIMLGTIVLILFYPLAAFLFFMFFLKLMPPRPTTPPPLPRG